jgi:hypothetical protein
MSTGIRPPVRSDPLEGQIMRAELRFQDRRRRIRAGADKLERDVRRQLTSPCALLLAGGLGFVAGDLAARDCSDSRLPGSDFFTRAVSIIAVVRSLLTSIQAMQRPAVECDGASGKQER